MLVLKHYCFFRSLKIKKREKTYFFYQRPESTYFPTATKLTKTDFLAIDEETTLGSKKRMLQTMSQSTRNSTWNIANWIMMKLHGVKRSCIQVHEGNLSLRKHFHDFFSDFLMKNFQLHWSSMQVILQLHMEFSVD